MATIAHDTGFHEIAERVWVARYERFDVNVSVVAGSRGLLVVDTFTSEDAARGVLDDVRRIPVPGSTDLVAVVNTHVHFDHTFGNRVFAREWPEAELVCHEDAAAALPVHAEQVRGAAEGGEQDIASTRELVPTSTFSSARAIDLGDRMVELVHPGRGHTDGDVVLRVPDVDLLLAGDLVEESVARNGVPGFGDDCWPMDWPTSLDLVIQLLTDDSVVVPGHGNPVDKDFVLEQRSAIGTVAETIRDLAGRGVTVTEALAEGQWPYPAEDLAVAVRRGFEHLPPSARSLPLA